MIVKVQRPLVGTPAVEPSILVYDEKRKHMVQVTRRSLPEWMLKLLHENPKTFVNATWSKGKWTFKDPAPWQYW